MKYSERLGEISNKQFQKALDTFNLGKFIKAEPISQGLFGQNVYVTSDKGEFVLRGKPHYDWQFPNEKLIAESLHEKTKVPVPFPYLPETNKEIFGWEFILMPRMKGKNLSDNLSEKWLSDVDRIEIAKAQGTSLQISIVESLILLQTRLKHILLTGLQNFLGKYLRDWKNQHNTMTKNLKQILNG